MVFKKKHPLYLIIISYSRVLILLPQQKYNYCLHTFQSFKFCEWNSHCGLFLPCRMYFIMVFLLYTLICPMQNLERLWYVPVVCTSLKFVPKLCIAMLSYLSSLMQFRGKMQCWRVWSLLEGAITSSCFPYTQIPRVSSYCIVNLFWKGKYYLLTSQYRFTDISAQNFRCFSTQLIQDA